MAKSKKSPKKPSVKVKDLRAAKNPKGGGKVKIQDISITHTVDKSSPTL